MNTPDSIKIHETSYENDAWKQYTAEELAGWVHLLTKRAGQRTDRVKIEKDLTDASNYLDMLIQHGLCIFTVFGTVYTAALLRKNIDDMRYTKLVPAPEAA